MTNYEVVFIVQPDLDEEALATLTGWFSNLVQGLGGQVTKFETWGKRQLAYPIRKLREGYYYVAQLQVNKEALKELERSLRLNERIIRYLLVRQDRKP